MTSNSIWSESTPHLQDTQEGKDSSETSSKVLNSTIDPLNTTPPPPKN